MEPVPLSLEDVLHPEEGDFIVQTEREARSVNRQAATAKRRAQAVAQAQAGAEARIRELEAQLMNRKILT
jgi:hypothetical protein